MSAGCFMTSTSKASTYLSGLTILNMRIRFPILHAIQGSETSGRSLFQSCEYRALDGSSKSCPTSYPFDFALLVDRCVGAMNVFLNWKSRAYLHSLPRLPRSYSIWISRDLTATVNESELHHRWKALIG